MAVIQAVLGFLVTPLTAIYKYIKSRSQKSLQKQESMQNGVRALLRAEIIEVYNQRMEKGYCPIYALENIHDMHVQYKNLGGNGTVDLLVQELEHLPRKPTEN